MVRSAVMRVVRLVLGWTCLVLGVIGLFVPVLQGILLLLLGMALLSKDSRWARRCLLRLRRRYPGAYDRMHRFKERITAVLNRPLGSADE